MQTADWFGEWQRTSIMAGQEGNFTFWVCDSKGFSLALLGLLDFVNGLLVYCALVLTSFLAFEFLVIAFLLFYLNLIICFRIGSAFLVLLQASRFGLSLIKFHHQLVIFLFNYRIENIFLFCLNSMFVKFGVEQLQMARKIQHSAERPAFFKALMGDFSQDLRIPSAFIKNFYRGSLHICGLKGHSGQCWAVELEKRGNRLFFQKGWERFVKHHSLQVGDFLIFSYDGVSMFDVTVYGKTCCEKIVKPAKRISDSNANADKRRDKLPRRSDSHADKRRVHFNLPAVDHVEETSLGSIPFQSENSYVARTLKRDTLYELYISKEVVATEGLKPGMTVKVKDTFGMSWSLKLCGSAVDDRVLMRSGLADICKASIASPGDTLVFEFVKPRVVQLHVIKAAGAYY